MAKTDKDIENLLSKFNQLDKNPTELTDYILSSSQTKSGIKPGIASQDYATGQLTEDDILQLRLAREQELAVKRGLIKEQAIQTPKRIARIAKVGKLRSGLGSLPGIVKKEKEETASLIDEFELKTKTLKKNKQLFGTSSFKSGLQSLTFKEDDENKELLTTPKAFEYDFLISTSGVLNKDVLLQLLIDTWEEKEKMSSEKEQKEGEGSLGDIFGTLSFLFGLFFGNVKKFWSALKGVFNVLLELPKKLKKGIGKVITSFKNMISRFISGVKTAMGKIKSWVKNLAKKEKTLIKKAGQQASKVWNSIKNSKVVKGMGNFMRKTGRYLKSIKIPKYLSLPIKFGTKALSWLTSGLEAYDLWQGNPQLESLEYVDEIKKMSTGRLLLNFWRIDMFYENLEELMLRGIINVAEGVKAASSNPYYFAPPKIVPQNLRPQVPEDISNPFLRYRHFEPNHKIVKEVPNVIISPRLFPKDGDAAPIPGIAYNGGM